MKCGFTSRALCIVLCAMLTFSIFSGAACAVAERPVVRVGFFAFDGYHMQDADGTRSGYGYEFLQRMVGYTRWRLEFVGYDKSWGDMQEMLANGEIDLLTSAQKTPERLERFDFSEESIGTSQTILTAKAGDTTYAMEDYANWNGMRVGMLQGNSRNDSFAQFAAMKGFAYVPVMFDSTAAMLNALQKGGVINTVVTSNLRSVTDEWILTQFDASPFYIMVRKGNTELLNQLNGALDDLFSAEPGLCAELMNKYYSPDSGDEIAYTAEERAFIRAMQDTQLTAIIHPNHPPYSYLENGRLTGILYDLAQEIAKRSMLNIQFADVQTVDEYDRRLLTGDFDIRFDAGDQYARADELDYRLTVSYLQVPISRVFLRSQHSFSSAAMLHKGDLSKKQTDALLSHGIETVYYNTPDEVIEAVLFGKQDATYLNSSAAMRAVRSEPTNRLIAEELHDYTSNYSVGVDANLDPLLYSILNKSAASIWEPEIDAASQRYTAYAEQPFSLIGYMYDNPVHIVGMVATFFLLGGLIFLVNHLCRKRKRDAQRLLEEERRNELLADALSTAESADAAKSQFLSRMSHEMRTPLNAIIGFMELAKDADAESTKTYIANSNTAAKQLLAVINDVLDMSSIESGKLKIAHSPFDLRQMIQALTNIYLPLCAQKGLEYETKMLTPTDDWLIGDQLRVNQILMNLLGNAVKFTEKGHIWLSISQRESRNNEIFIRLEVSDTGCGMGDDMQKRLFHPFEQESATTARKHGGSGLGLSIVKSLVTMMNGAIRVESEPGKGTTFTVDLPFEKSELGKSLWISQRAQSMRILAVDDEPNERDYLSIVLDRMGVRHACVKGSEEALSALAEAAAEDDPYRVCLIDWRMPHIDGIETTRRIRAKYGDEVIVIVVSAYEQNQVSESAKAAGANLFISKPLFQSSLFDLLMTLTGGELAKGPAAPSSHDFTGKRVLLAEDNAMNRLVAVGLLKKLQLECDAAEDGKAAADMFIASPPGYYSAILMDIQMPVMDGYEATGVIRASGHPDAKTVPIIALTANAFNEDIAKTLSVGMNAHVSKPIDSELLAKALAEAFAANAHSAAQA